MNFVGPYSDLPLGAAIPVSRPGRHTDIRKVAPATGFPIPLSEIKADLRVDSDDEDPTIQRMARAAAAFLEIRTGCAVLAGRYEANFNEWCMHGPWEFNRWPLRTVTQISYLRFDGTGNPPVWTDVDLAQFRVESRSRSFLIQPHYSFRAPQVYSPYSGIRVRFLAGFDVDAESGGPQVSDGEPDEGESREIEDGMRALLQMMICHYYDNRDLFVAGKISDIEAGAGSLLAGYRMFW